MTPELVLFAIKSLVRVGQQADKALVEYAADQAAVFPDAMAYELRDQQTALTNLLRQPRYAFLRTQPPFGGGLWVTIEGGKIDRLKWDALDPAKQQAAFDTAAAAAANDIAGLAILVLEDVQRAPASDEKGIGLALVNQWKKGSEPIAPIGRVVLAIAEVALQYVAIDPSIVGVRGGRGEKILKSFATAIATPVTKGLNADQLGAASQIFDDMMTALAGAAFEAFKANIGEIISDQKLATLVGNVLDPVVTAVKAGDAPFQRRMQTVLDALLGPAAAAAMKAVAEHPEAFFGPDFDKSKAAGALVSALLVEAARDSDVRKVFSKDGLISERGLIALLSAVLDVAARKPEFFINIDNDKKATLAKDVIAAVASAIKTEVAQLPTTKSFDPRQLAGRLAAAAIEAAGRHTDAIVGNSGKKWHEAATDLVKKVLGDLAAALNDPDQGKALQKLFSEDQLVELGRIVMQGIAATPGMLGVRDADVRVVIAALATAMAADKRSLLGPDAWLDLARAMVKEIAARPSTIAGSDKRLQAVVEALGKVIAGDTNATLTAPDVTAVARALLTELAGNPALFAGLRSEMMVVVQAIARAMALDVNRLLSGADWAEILKVAAAEASANPARLFGLNFNDAGQALAADAIGLVRRSLPAALPAGGPLILKGEVLREATILLLRHLAGSPEKAKKYMPLLQSAVREAFELVAANPGSYGSRELLQLIRALGANILAGKHDAQLAQVIAGQAVKLLPTIQDADALLARGA